MLWTGECLPSRVLQVLFENRMVVGFILGLFSPISAVFTVLRVIPAEFVYEFLILSFDSLSCNLANASMEKIS